MKVTKSLCLILLLALPVAVMAEGGNCKRTTLDKRFSDMDTNHDGTIDRAEFHAMMDKQFDEMDTDHDGTLSKEEMLKYRGLMMKEHATKDSKE